ncbi:FeoA family protein [Luteococcus japonicus]|nr:FeoA family protein [Luteococcus japonicus]
MRLEEPVDLLDGQPGTSYVIERIVTSDTAMDSFLLRLGAYPGERITLVSKKRRACIVVVKNPRYSLGANLARAVFVRPCRWLAEPGFP